MKNSIRMAFVVGALCLVSRAHASLAGSGLQCVTSGNQSELRRSDGLRLGDPISAAECSAVVQASREGAVCTQNAGAWTPTSVFGGQTLGDPVGFDDCQRAVRAAHADLVCTKTTGSLPWRPTHTTSRFALGRFGTSLDDCLELTANASPGVVCTNTGTFGFKGRKPTIVDDKAFTDSNLLGASGQQAFCVQSTREARSGQVCACNGDFCGADRWILYDLSTRSTVGSTTDLKSCIDSQF